MKMKEPRPEFWTAFFTALVAGFTGALAGATFYAVFYAQKQINEAKSESQVEHILTLQRQYEQEPLVTYRKRLAEEKLKGQQEPGDLYKVLDFFETVGELVDRHYLDETDVWDAFAYPILILNADNGTMIQEYRQSDPAAYEEFTSMVRQLQQTESEHNGALQHISPDDIREFYQEESSVGAGDRLAPRNHPTSQSK